MNRMVVTKEDELTTELHDSNTEVRQNAAKEMGILPISNDRFVIALLETMLNNCEFKVREMAYWALSSPANQEILNHHQDWQARINPPTQKPPQKTNWLTSFLTRFKEKTK
jgi:hypothetical protein